MKRNKKRIVAAVLAICALAAGGAAFTNSIDTSGIPTNVAGYASVTVHGATLNDATYTFDTTGANITAVTLKFNGDLTGDEVEASFNGTALTDCGTVASGDVSGGVTTKTCSISQSTTGALSLNVVVANN